MQSMIFFGLLLATTAFANPHYEKYAAVPVVHNKVVGYSHHTPLHTVQKVHHTVHPVVTPVHHPAVTSVHHEPTAVLAQAPKISGYQYTSQVRHDAQLSHGYAAPALHAAPAHYAAPALHAAPAHYAAPAVVSAHGGYGHGGYGHGGYAHAPAPYVSSSSLAVAPAKIVETPAVSSYSLETGRIDTASKVHYGTVHTPVVTKVGYAAAPVLSHGHGLGHGSHY